jgi:sensor histidine kinase regulating citrate/malate metabolism
MKKLIKIIFLLLVFGVFIAALAMAMSKKKLAAMTPDEIRSFLEERVGDKVTAEQLNAIQTAVVGAVHGHSSSDDQPTDGSTDGPEVTELNT